MNAITQLVESTPRLQRKALSPLLAVLASSAIFYTVLLVNLVPTDSRADEPEEVVVEDGPSPEVLAAQARALSGEWTYVSGAAGRERIADAIEDATEGLIVGREIAQERLAKALQPAQSIDLRIEDSEVSLAMGTMSVRDVALGRWVDWSHAGTDYQLRFTMTEGGDLIQDIRSSDCEIRRRFRVEDERLRVRFEMKHERLDAPVKYWLAYQ